jgi:hypothetical protein
MNGDGVICRDLSLITRGLSGLVGRAYPAHARLSNADHHQGCHMRALPSLTALIVGLALQGAYAQSVAQGERPKEPVKDLRAQTDTWFKDCKQGWDAGTHMSRRDYERTCLRMAQERVKFMRDWEKTGADHAKSK